MRRQLTLTTILLAALLAGCGDDAAKPAAGSPEYPLVAQLDDDSATRLASAAPDPDAGAAADKAPGYQKLVEGQKSKPRSRFTPCGLVTKQQARTIVGKPVADPLEAPLGPTCIYRSDAADLAVTVAVQSVKFSTLKPKLQQAQQVAVSDRSGYCGYLGEPMLYVPITDGRVLSIGAPCGVAKKFAIQAVQRLPQ